MNEQDTLEDWIKRAKRAHELVSAVDLDKIAQHDRAETAKLSSVQDALEDISNGEEVGHVDGVDDIVHDMDVEQVRRSELLRVLAAAGMTAKLSSVLSYDGESDNLMQPLDLIPHTEGLPEFDACLAPDITNEVGHSGIFLGRQGVFAATIAEPTSKHQWRIVRSRPYESHEEMVNAIQAYFQFPSK